MLKYNVIPRKNPVTKSVQYYAQLAPVTPMRLAEVAEAISRQCTVTVHDVKAVLSALDEHVTEALLNGRSVRFGDLGSFHVTLGSKGTADAESFKVANIQKIKVRFIKGAKMRFLISRKNPDLQLKSAKETE